MRVRTAAVTMTLAGGLIAGAFVPAASAASTNSTKTCDTGRDHFTQTQTSACISNADVNQGDVTNSGGQTPPGQQK